MPLFETPPEAVDRVYAESLFELAEREGGRDRLEALSDELDQLVELTRSNAEFSEFLSSRIVAEEKRSASLRTMLDGNVSGLVLRFILVLNDKGRLMRFLTIVAAFQELVRDRFGKVEVDVFTRHPLSSDQVDQIRERLRSAIGREPVVYAYTEEGMIGGVKMQIGDRLFDNSIQTKIRNMSELLVRDGQSLIRARAGEAYDD